VDIETDTDKRYGSALLGEPNFISWCDNGVGWGVKSQDLTEWLLKHFLQDKFNGYILYAHNGFGFDFKRVKWDVLADKGFTADFLNGKDGSIKSVTLRIANSEWIIRDSYLLIPRKLSEVTKKFAPEHQKIKREQSFENSVFDPDNKNDVDYAIQDSVGLWYSILEVDRILKQRFNVSIHEAATLPGIAFRAFRLMFKAGDRSAGIYAEKYPGISWGLAHAARESYHGGQTIAFRTTPTRDVVSLDANSMYSHVMLKHKLPTGEVKRYAALPPMVDSNRCLCLAIVHIPKNVFPMLKSKTSKGGVGNYRGVVTGWYWLFELEKQKELGATFEVIECYVWETSTSCASRFVDKCKSLRMEDYFGAIGEIAKLLANALYGKFAQQTPGFNYVMSKTMPDDAAVPFYNPQTKQIVSNLWQVEAGFNYSADMTHWASFITAHARLMLTEAIQKAGFENILYCDTDSIFIERKHIERVRSIMGKEYGQFKIEKGSEEKGIPFQAIAPKAYLFIETNNKIKIKNKGIPTSAILKQNGVARIGEDNQKIEFISSSNLWQMIKNNKEYGRKSFRRMATEKSTTNGEINNGRWEPSVCEPIAIHVLRGDEQLNIKTPRYLSTKFAIILNEFNAKEAIENEARENTTNESEYSTIGCG